MSFMSSKKIIGLGDTAYQKLIERVDIYLGEPLRNAAIEYLGDQISYQNLHMIHDINDRIVSIKDARRVDEVWKNTALHEIEGTGHYKMLWAPKVANIILNIFNNDAKNALIQDNPELELVS